MSNNLLHSLQDSLGLNPIKKIDPNTQQVIHPENHDKFSQSAVPTVLLGLYKFGNTEQGSASILRGSAGGDWFSEFFGDKTDEAIAKVSEYSGESTDYTSSGLREIANRAVGLIREQVPVNADFAAVKSYINEQRNPILKSLPAELQLGYLFNDNSIDDRTHKMEGPMSNHMHFFEKLFSGSTTEKNENTQNS
jgi:hypothetical protein